MARSPFIFQSAHTSVHLSPRPILPGRTLSSDLQLRPLRAVLSLSSLTSTEFQDLWSTTQTVVQRLTTVEGISAFTIETKDALPSVSWLTVNIIPRRHGDLPENDQIYRLLDREDLVERAEPADLEREAEEMRRLLG